MLFRKKQKDIINWINNGTNALLVTGARQVGKTFLIRECLNSESVDYLEINLIKEPKYISTFESAIEKDLETLLQTFSVIANRPLIKGKTVIFIDEVQECKEIVTAIKFLVEDGRYRYILSGSLLGVELVDLRSAPVGYLSTITMYPLDLEEFLIANDLNEKFIVDLKNCFINKIPVNNVLHDKLIEAFYRYLIVGGMPKAVSIYIETNDLMSVSNVHLDIKNEYLKDFTKYENDKSKKLKLIKTYELIPSELNEQNKRYIFKHLDDNLKFDRYENSFNWLIDAGVAIPVYNSTEPMIPLEVNKKSSLFKFFLSDVGMLTTSFGRNTILKLLSKDQNINYGAVFENFVAQELNSHNIKSYYYVSKKYGELDFVIEYFGEVLPIEVKSGKNYTQHSALNNILSIDNYNIKNAFVFSNSNITVNDKITYYPIYMIMFLNNDIIELPKLNDLNLKDIKI